MNPTVHLTGPDGSNPLGFLAALGVLRVLDDAARRGAGPFPRLAWRDEGRWIPTVAGWPDLDAIVEAILEDREDWRSNPVLRFAYDREGEAVDADSPGAIRDLKPPPALFRSFLARLSDEGPGDRRRRLDVAAAFAAEGVIDKTNGDTKPTAFHFTSGQQTFLRSVAEIHAGLTRGHVVEAIEGPWLGTSTLKSLSWDATATRTYALRASNPAKENRPGIPGADWLAFRALPLFPVFARAGRAFTTAVPVARNAFKFTWPIWSAPAAERTVASLLATPDLATTSPEWRRARGVDTVFVAVVGRFAKGYGCFAPAHPT